MLFCPPGIFSITAAINGLIMRCTPRSSSSTGGTIIRLSVPRKRSCTNDFQYLACSFAKDFCCFASSLESCVSIVFLPFKKDIWRLKSEGSQPYSIIRRDAGRFGINRGSDKKREMLHKID